MTEEKLLNKLSSIVHSLRELNGLAPKVISPDDTPFNERGGLDSLNALEAEADLAETLGVSADSEILAPLRNPELKLREVAKLIAKKTGAGNGDRNGE
jgi:acyl carrier protein